MPPKVSIAPPAPPRPVTILSKNLTIPDKPSNTVINPSLLIKLSQRPSQEARTLFDAAYHDSAKIAACLSNVPSEV
jgi:hypothetical protein